MLLGNILNLPLIDRYTPPARQPDTQEPAPPSNGATQPEPADGGTKGSSGSSGQAQPASNTPGGAQSHAPSSGATAVDGVYRTASMTRTPEEPKDGIRIEAWARRAALQVQKNEQFASMLQRISSPESAARIALLHNVSENGADLPSVTSAYRENQDHPPAAPGSSES